MNDQKYWRQLNIVDVEKLKTPITIIGAGAIGSFTALTLAKMGCSNITSYDMDSIEEHNLPNQFFRNKDEGQPKVKALAEILSDFTDVKLEIKEEKYEKQKLKGIIISTVDNMKTRKDIFDNCKYDPNIKLFVDGRMGAEVMRIYTIKTHDVDDIKLYQKNLYSDEEAETERCSEKAIIYNVLVESGLIANQVKKFVMGQEYKKEIIFDVKNLILM